MRAAWAVQGVGYLVLIAAVWYLVAIRPQGPPGAVPTSGTATDTPKQSTMPLQKTSQLTLRSPAFPHEGLIPAKYTCDGDDVSPPLAVDGLPAGTVSLVLIADDPDAPGGTWDHWVAFNVPPTTSRIGEGEKPQGTAGKNSWGLAGYGGPCPPSGEHRYLFRLYALDTSLRIGAGAAKAAVLEAMQGHVLESSTLMGRYARPKS